MVDRSLIAPPPRNLPSGVDLMRRINDGMVKKNPSEYLESVRDSIVENCDELLEVGARIRPLMVDGKQVGWVRGIHNTERRRVSRWVYEPNKYATHVLTLATSLKKEEIEDLSSLELHNLVELVQKMTEYDMSLYPYLSAFASTLSSENLWHSRGVEITSFDNKLVELPDGHVMRILTAPNHSRLWATLCVYREQAKARLDDNWNSLLQIRPMAGKSADPLAAKLKTIAKSLVTDSMEPWESLVKIQPAINLDDGWAHSENMETREGALKELQGMMSNDRHERLMEKFQKQQIEAAEARKKELENLVSKRGGLGINMETVQVETDAEVRRREADLKKGRIPPPMQRSKTETTPNPVERIKRYK